MNCSWRWQGNAFVKPSAGISVVGIHLTLTCPAWTSWCNQCWWISMWCNFVDSFWFSLVKSLIVWRLSQWTVSSCPGSNSMFLKNLCHHMVSFVAYDRANSSASVLEVVTVFCFIECQSAGPPKSLYRKPPVLLRVSGSSAYAASLAQKKICCPSPGVGAEYSIAYVLVL